MGSTSDTLSLLLLLVLLLLHYYCIYGVIICDKKNRHVYICLPIRVLLLLMLLLLLLLLLCVYPFRRSCCCTPWCVRRCFECSTAGTMGETAASSPTAGLSACPAFTRATRCTQTHTQPHKHRRRPFRDAVSSMSRSIYCRFTKLCCVLRLA